MARLASAEASEPISMLMARHAISRVARRAPEDANLLALCHWVRRWIRYCHELPETMATLSALDKIPAGDCDDMVIALSSLAWRLGYGWDRQRYAIGYRNGKPRHVWLEVLGRAGRWVPLDASTFRIEPGQSPASWFERTERFQVKRLI